MKPTVYLSDPEAMRKARLNQPPVTSEQLRAQFEVFRRESGRLSKAAKSVTSSLGHAKSAA